jgi:hypothetical protein
MQIAVSLQRPPRAAQRSKKFFPDEPGALSLPEIDHCPERRKTILRDLCLSLVVENNQSKFGDDTSNRLHYSEKI